MAYLRRLPSGRWQATVRHPHLPKNRNRISETFTLQRAAKDWAREQEAAFAQGETRDPRTGQITVGQWWDRCEAAQVAATTTRGTNRSYWSRHCAPRWARWPMNGITRMEAQGWVRELEVTPRLRDTGRRAILDEDESPYLAPKTVRNVVAVMTSLFRTAVEETPPVVLTNPFSGLDLPTAVPGRIVFYTRAEHAAILEALRPAGERWEVLADLAGYVGLRYGELAGLPGDHVDWLRNQVSVRQVWTVHGLRGYAKSRRSHRTVPVPEWIIEGMARLMQGRPRTALIFADPDTNRPPRYDQWYGAWYPAVELAGVPAYPPHALRHTAASWLVQDGVDLYRVQALLGHESYRTTQRYAHLAPDAHDEIRRSWQRHDAPGTHTAKVIDLRGAEKGR